VKILFIITVLICHRRTLEVASEGLDEESRGQAGEPRSAC
jgi:hypothetical protein